MPSTFVAEESLLSLNANDYDSEWLDLCSVTTCVVKLII